jgi:hypothetical protein
MPIGRLFIEQGATPARALAAGGSLWTVLSSEQPVAIYATQLRGEALVLGRHQRVSQALSADAARLRPVLRRSSGGATVDVGDGVSYVALALRERSTLMASQLGYPPRQDDPLRGRTPTTLEEAGADLTGPLMLEQFAQGYSTGYKVEWHQEKAALLSAPDAELLAPREDPREYALSWSAPREEAIGFVSAGVALDGAGKIDQLSMAGDFFAHRACAETLERTLLGVSPSSELIARAVDTAYAQPAHDFEGVRNLRSLQEAILDAADLAKRALDVH